MSWPPKPPGRFELSTISRPSLADVRHEVVLGRVQLRDGRRRGEAAVGQLAAYVDVLVAADVVALAREEEEDRALGGLDERRPELAAGEVGSGAGRIAAEVLDGPAVSRVVAAEVDVTGSAAAGTGRDEQEGVPAERRRAEVREWGVHGHAEVLGRPPRSIDRPAVEHPDVVRVGATGPTGAVQGDVEAEAIRRLDRTALGRRGVDARLGDRRSPGAVGQNASQMWNVVRPNSRASEP